MKERELLLNGMPAIELGENSDKAFLFLHGKLGCKEEARAFAEVVCPKGYKVVGVDLPEHGRRKNDAASLVPWTVVPELRGVMELLKAEYSEVSVRANSIGAWFAMQAFQNEALAHCLFVSPILDMRALIENMMAWAGVTEERLRREGEIPTEFGEVLSWRYYSWVKEHPVLNWDVRTDILYAGNDTMTNRETAGSFAAAHSCGLTVMENGEHWFHTAEQLDFLRSWEDNVT